MKSTNPTTLATRRYVLQLTLAMLAYVAVLCTTLVLLERLNPQGLPRTLLALAPVVPVAFLIPIVARFFRDTDEFERRLATEAFAIGAGITAILAATYGFLENAGLPHLSAWWTWGVVMGSSAIARIVLNRRYQ
jgi:hypothetical protein